MPVALFTHPACLDHDPGPWHPERPDRLRAVLQALEHPDFTPLLRERCPPATDAQLALVHPPDYAAAILAIRPEGRAYRAKGLAGLGKLGLRPPVAPMDGPNVDAREGGARFCARRSKTRNHDRTAWPHCHGCLAANHLGRRGGA